MLKVNTNKFLDQLKILFVLLKSDLIRFKHEFKKSFIDGLLWPIKTIIIFSYIMPGLGIQANYGPFILTGTVVAVIFFSIFRNVNSILFDEEFHGLLSYELTLPCWTSLIFIRKVISFSFKPLIRAFLTYIVGSLLLSAKFSVLPASVFKTSLIFLSVVAMFSSLSLLLSGLIKNKAKDMFHTVYPSLLFTSWELGCYFFSWKILFVAIPALAYLMLLNPFTFAVEGFRSAVLGSEMYINFWICLLLVIFFSFCFFVLGLRQIKRKFDCI